MTDRLVEGTREKVTILWIDGYNEYRSETVTRMIRRYSGLPVIWYAGIVLQVKADQDGLWADLDDPISTRLYR